MNKLLLGLLILGSMPAFAQEEKVMDRENLTILNDIVGAINTTKAAKIFIKNTGFDEVSASYSADGKDSIINVSGMLLFGGDIACGSLKLKIERSQKFNGWGLTSTYKATLDKSTLVDAEYCEVQE